MPDDKGEVMQDELNITFDTLRPGIVRLSWDGFAGAGTRGGCSAGRCYVDFDGCPTRHLSPMDAAQHWARTVLGWGG